MAFPSDLDTFNGTTAQGTSTLSSPDHALDHRTLGSAALALESKVGVGAGSPTLNRILVGDGNGTATWGTLVANFRLNSSLFSGGTVASGVINSNDINGGTISGVSIQGTTTLGGTLNAASGIIGTPQITGGTASAITLGTPTIGTVTIPGTVTALGFSAAIAPGVGSVADVASGTLTVNAQAGQVYYSVQGTAAGNRTIAAPLNPTGYQQLTYAFKTSGSANATAVWNSIFRFSQDVGTPALGTGVTWNYFGWRYNPIDTKWDFVGQSKNII